MTRRLARPSRKGKPRAARVPPRTRKFTIALAASFGLTALGLFAASWIVGKPARLADRARQAAKIRDWDASAKAWHDYNDGASADPVTLLEEARAWLALGHAAKAETALDRAIAADPAPPEPWLLLLEMLRVEDRTVEAQDLGWRAYESAPKAGRRPLLKALTLALLAEAPESVARPTLGRWSAADPDDIEARIALLKRMAATPRPDDPDLPARIAEIRAILGHHPESVSAREALILALAESGDPEPGRHLLETWPESRRDARFLRLKGRYVLETDRKPAVAIPHLTRTLERLPHDWRTRNRLARALNATGRQDEAQKEAGTVEKLREWLDPVALGKRLDADLAGLDDPRSRLDLADLCGSVGLSRLAEAWRLDTP